MRDPVRSLPLDLTAQQVRLGHGGNDLREPRVGPLVSDGLLQYRCRLSAGILYRTVGRQVFDNPITNTLISCHRGPPKKDRRDGTKSRSVTRSATSPAASLPLVTMPVGSDRVTAHRSGRAVPTITFSPDSQQRAGTFISCFLRYSQAFSTRQAILTGRPVFTGTNVAGGSSTGGHLSVMDCAHHNTCANFFFSVLVHFDPVIRADTTGRRRRRRSNGDRAEGPLPGRTWGIRVRATRSTSSSACRASCRTAFSVWCRPGRTHLPLRVDSTYRDHGK